ncbi:hypothetical protein RHGRI_022075 [Rhododendron griersonianum]|uniref:Uncharacterized protein n=1 Tax=Rhododendron griersonianum TaxID=479676 RepID=A0AAV6JQV1_9ERIC|nr:hypothetical protein RHGRI_022075 [Rhododendron griersonianum]
MLKFLTKLVQILSDCRDVKYGISDNDLLRWNFYGTTTFHYWGSIRVFNLPYHLSAALSLVKEELRVTLNGNTQYAAVQSTSNGAPFCAITVCDTIGELPEEMERPAKKRC